jgi:hypothetical protein
MDKLRKLVIRERVASIREQVVATLKRNELEKVIFMFFMVLDVEVILI